jgi:hypothetical protein
MNTQNVAWSHDHGTSLDAAQTAMVGWWRCSGHEAKNVQKDVKVSDVGHYECADKRVYIPAMFGKAAGMNGSREHVLGLHFDILSPPFLVCAASARGRCLSALSHVASGLAHGGVPNPAADWQVH